MTISSGPSYSIDINVVIHQQDVVIGLPLIIKQTGFLLWLIVKYQTTSIVVLSPSPQSYH